MPVFAVTGAVLSLPSGIVVQKLGLKAAGYTAIGCVVVGCTGGALSPAPATLIFWPVIFRLGRYQEKDDAGDIN
jgi:fucose permease